VALADGNRERLAREPRLVEATPLPGRVGNGPGLLVLEPDAGRESEPEAVRVLRDRIDAQPLAHGVEEDVARLDDRRVEVDRPMPPRPPAAEEVVAERDAAAARKARGWRRRPAFECRGRDRDLEGRPGWELSLHGAVVQGMLRILDQIAPLVPSDAA